ncbi:hypothetical protein E2I00_003420 [Balaenoptera physalus]|uniref:PH domain-containing protein n=1 Tax=Balaenoptera physalus TaxID=9770 RepID=A0A6A1QG45_BALPH|nr:hypothetical protein E2I00_003420 [Balaenoptera physalus]
MVERMEAGEQEMRREKTKDEELAVSELGREKGENLEGGLPEPQDWRLSLELLRAGYLDTRCRNQRRIQGGSKFGQAFVPNSSVSSTVLKRWKKNWFDQWSGGHLTYYDDQTRQSVEDKVHMPVDCINIRMGHECQDIQPPDGKAKDCCRLFAEMGKTISLCAESTDDYLAWKFTLQDARTDTAYVGSEVLYDETAVASFPPPYTAYAAPAPEQAYGYGPYSGAYPPGTQVVYAANGQAYAVPYQYPYAGLYGQQPANLVVIRERYRDNDSDLALGMLAAAATGMALGSLFWVF